MKPDFALSLSFNGISLLARDGSNWRTLDRVALDSPDLISALAAMRRKAEDTSGARVLSKLMIPEAQIRFMDIALPDSGAPEDAVREALYGATPYPVDDLIWDWGIVDGRIKIAAVARETLDEAEDFARTNGFNPVSFAAAAGVGGLGTEVFFGPTRLAASLLAPWQQVKRDGPPPVQALPGTEADPVSPAPSQPENVEAVQEAYGDMRAVEAGQAAGAARAPDGGATAQSAAHEGVEVPSQSTAATDGAAETPAARLTQPDATPAGISAGPARAEAERPAATAAPDAAEATDATASPIFAPDDGTDAQAEAPTEIGAPVFHHEPAPGEAPAIAARASEPGEASGSSDQPAGPAFGSSRTGSPALAGATPAQDPPPASFHSIRASRAADAPAAPRRLDGASRGAVSAPGIPIPGFRSLPDPVSVKDDLPPKPAPAIITEHRDGDDSGRESAWPLKLNNAQRRESGDAAAPAGKAVADDKLGRILQRSRAAHGAAIDTGGDVDAAEGAETPANRMKRLMATRSGNAAARDTDPETAAFRKQIEAEREQMTVFGARRAEANRVGGKPRFLGLVLTLILLGFMAAIAVATSFGDQIVALFRAPEAPITVTQAAPEILPEAPEDGTPTVSGPKIELTAAEPSTESAPVTPDVQALRQPAPQPSQAVTPEAAQARYAATGIWPAAPDAPMPPRISLQEQLQVASIAPGIGLPSLPARPEDGPQPSGDSGIRVQAPPPPGVIYSIDDRGMIVPTPEGIVTPERYLLVAGRPPVVPPSRVSVDPETGVVTLAALAQPEAITPGLAPLLRPEGLVPEQPAPDDRAEDPATAPTPAPLDSIATDEQPATAAGSDARPDAPEAAAEPAQTAPATLPFAGPTPRPRPAAIASLAPVGPARQDAAPEPVAQPAPAAATLPAFDGPRPLARPASVSSRSATVPAPPASEPVPLAPTEQNSDAAPAQNPFPNATNQAVAASITPSGRPSNFSRQVARAQSRAEQVPRQVAQVAPRTVRQSQPTATSVSKQATVRNAINLNRINLIGVYGKATNRRALVRLANGRYQKVKVGDRIDGGRVAAIGDGVLQYTKNGRRVTLQMPRS